MDRLIHDLLDFGSFENGRLRVIAVPQDIRDVVANTVEAFEPVAAARQAFESECIVSVTDTGIGIPKHELTSIFEQFHQLDAGDRRGLGLGLYISLWIVEAHGGRIWAESEIGTGTTVSFTLPRIS